MTWKEIKLATLQKMYAADGNTIPNDESTTDYLAGMPQVCNEALSILSRVGKFIIKNIEIAHSPILTMPQNTDSKLLIENAYTVSVSGAKSYYFEYSGTGTLDRYIDGELVSTEELVCENGYSKKRGLLDGGDVKFIFTPKYPFHIKNIAFYACSFASEDSVPAYGSKIRYNLPELAEDFYQIDSIYYEGENPRYIKSNEYFFEGNKFLVLDRNKAGDYNVYYRAYPPEITINTLDDYEFPVDKEISVLIPLYMASQLYKDDDAGIATGYRNEFEIELERLQNNVEQAPTAEEFVSESGWC